MVAVLCLYPPLVVVVDPFDSVVIVVVRAGVFDAIGLALMIFEQGCQDLLARLREYLLQASRRLLAVGNER
jgi:hypothetical protein